MISYYLYRHIRLDNNTIFYIGIGKINNKFNCKYIHTLYKRGYSNKLRSNTWYYITNKTDYKVEIMFETNSYDLIRLKEIEFIKLYGRRDIGNGTLVNHTDGGDGRLNPNIESMKNNGNNWKGIFGKFHRNAKEIYQYDMSGNFIKKYDTITDAHKETNICLIGIIKNAKKQITYFKNYQWFYTFQGDKIKPQKTVGEKAYKPICRCDLNTLEILETYDSIKSAIIKHGFKSQQHIGQCCHGKLKQAYGYMWKFI